MVLILKSKKKAIKDGRHLDSLRDLTTTDRGFLKEHEVRPDEFDKMDTQSQQEWVEEIELDAYSKTRKRKL